MLEIDFFRSCKIHSKRVTVILVILYTLDRLELWTKMFVVWADFRTFINHRSDLEHDRKRWFTSKSHLISFFSTAEYHKCANCNRHEVYSRDNVLHGAMSRDVNKQKQTYHELRYVSAIRLKSYPLLAIATFSVYIRLSQSRNMSTQLHFL